MIDLESMVKDILETEYGIEERIKEEFSTEIGTLVRSWMDRHNFNSTISDYITLAIDDSRIDEAIESAVEEFVDDAIR